MKAAVSIPDHVFREADRAAEHLGWSRSQLYAHALEQFLADQAKDPVTAALNALAEREPEDRPMETGRQLIDAGQWEW